MARLVPLAAVDADFLSDQGQDRTYSTLRALLNGAQTVIGARGSAFDADTAVAQVQRAFAARMVESSVFTKQLSGVRELRIALHRVTRLPEGEEREERMHVRGKERHTTRGGTAAAAPTGPLDGATRREWGQRAG
jgi:hypothetical protein